MKKITGVVLAAGLALGVATSASAQGIEGTILTGVGGGTGTVVLPGVLGGITVGATAITLTALITLTIVIQQISNTTTTTTT